MTTRFVPDKGRFAVTVEGLEGESVLHKPQTIPLALVLALALRLPLPLPLALTLTVAQTLTRCCSSRRT